jgi:hypothetical protein
VGKKGAEGPPVYIIYVYDIYVSTRNSEYMVYIFLQEMRVDVSPAVATCEEGFVQREREREMVYKKRKSATSVVRIMENNQDINLSATALPVLFLLSSRA